jgi:Domain of unknown function (DUF4124)
MGDKNLAIILILFFSTTAPAVKANTEIYKHVDNDGRITFSNKPIKGAERLQPASASPKFNAETAQNKKFPNVSNHTQKKRDIKRRQLLENELKNESRLLADAKHVLARTLKNSGVIKINTSQSQYDAIKHENKIKIIQKRVLLHERNITALKKELASL